MKWIKAIFVVLRQGEMLSDPGKWKNRQQTGNALLAILGALVPLLGGAAHDLQPDDLVALAGGIAVALGLLNAYFIPATSDKVGLPPRRGNPDHPFPGDDSAMG